MEDDGGQYLISPVDPEIKDAMRRILKYFEKAHKIKATKLSIKKLKKGIALWMANMTAKDDKDFSYELTNRKGHINICWELVKWMLFMSDHTLVALLTVTFEKFGIKYGSEEHSRLMQQSKDLRQEFKVQFFKEKFIYNMNCLNATILFAILFFITLFLFFRIFWEKMVYFCIQPIQLQLQCITNR